MIELFMNDFITTPRAANRALVPLSVLGSDQHQFKRKTKPKGLFSCGASLWRKVGADVVAEDLGAGRVAAPIRAEGINERRSCVGSPVAAIADPVGRVPGVEKELGSLRRQALWLQPSVATLEEIVLVVFNDKRIKPLVEIAV